MTMDSVATALPRVSVLVATYNGAALVGETLRSVLAQDLPGFEIVVVDDGSTDNTRDVVQAVGDPRIRRFVTPQNLGPPGARNFAFAQCRGRYVAPVDQDDILLPNRLARQAAYLDRHESTVAVATATERLLDNIRVASPQARQTSPGYVRWALLVGNPLVWSSVMIRKEAVDRLGVFNRQDRIFAEDFDLYHRLAAIGSIARIDEVLTLYRVHAAGASQRNAATMRANATLVLAEALAPILGEAACRTAHLVSRHIACGETVPDIATLSCLESLLLALTRHVKGHAEMDAVARGLIARERAAILQRIIRTALRHGTVSPMALQRLGLLRSAGVPTASALRDTMHGRLRRILEPRHRAA